MDERENYQTIESKIYKEQWKGFSVGQKRVVQEMIEDLEIYRNNRAHPIYVSQFRGKKEESFIKLYFGINEKEMYSPPLAPWEAVIRELGPGV